jgi:hypothetical protein
LDETKRNGKSYRKGFMCCNVVMCVVVMVGLDGRKWKGLQKGVFMCCNVLMCVVFMDGRKGGKCKGLHKGVFMCCNVVMCAEVTACEREREMERIT